MYSSRIIRRSQVSSATVLISQRLFMQRLDPTPPEEEPPPPPPEPEGPSEAELLLRQAEETLQAARAEAEQLRTRANAEGRAEGYQDGLAAVHRELAESVGRISQLVEQARIAQSEILRSTEREAVELAIAVAQKVIGAELAIRPELVRDVIASALRELELSSVVRVRVHPDDARLLDEWWRDYLPAEHQSAIQLVADSQIARGGCIIDTRTGLVDSQIATRFDQLSAALLQEAEPNAPAAAEPE